MKKFYITTAIDYPNGSPHLGHAYEKVITDTYARWYRLMGDQVYFLTGTDENGQKLVRSAEVEGVEVGQFVDQNAEKFRNLCSKIGTTHDDFIRTTELRHIRIVQDLWKKFEASGDLYFDTYEGDYCLSCEAFYSEAQAPGCICPEHHLPLEKVKEEGYFFRLSKYAEWIEEYIKAHPNFIMPKLFRSEMLNRITSEPMKDLSVTRPNKGWGIEVPSDKRFVIYTWFDALINYYSALVDKGLQSQYWPANVHVIGRDILWFHSVIWPVMLHSLGLGVPDQVYVHGMILAEDGKKMSKSLGNGVDPMDVLSQYPSDTFRYYLLRAIPADSNGKFSLADLAMRHQSELGNDFGNVLMRVVKLLLKRGINEVDVSHLTPLVEHQKLLEAMKIHMDQREHHRAIELVWSGMKNLNSMINTLAPWSIKDDAEKSSKVGAEILYSMASLSVILSPFLPNSCATVFQCLGVESRTDGKWKKLKLSDPPVMFPRELNS